MKKKIELRSKLKKVKGIEVYKIGKSTVIVKQKPLKVYELNESGTKIWRMIEKGKSIKEIVKKMYEVYKNKNIKRDVLSFLQQLRKIKIVEIKE